MIDHDTTNGTQVAASEAGRSRSRAGLAVGVAAGLVGGAAAGLVIGVPGISGAADAPTALVRQVDDEAPDTTDTDTTDTDTDTSDPDTDTESGDDVAERGDRLRELLEPLIADGTITAEQADAVTEQLVDSVPDVRWRRGHGHGHGRFGGPVGRGAVSDAVTELLGLEPEAVREALRDGSTLAELAEANGVSTDVLVGTLVTEAAERLDVAVENGRIDAERAAEFEERLEEQITERVNGEFRRRGN